MGIMEEWVEGKILGVELRYGDLGEALRKWGCSRLGAAENGGQCYQ